MLFMVIERFRNRDAEAIYGRVKEKGRMLPEGLHYLGSWIEPDFSRCFQLMECDDPNLFQQWKAHWQDLVEFEIVPVQTSTQAQDGAASIIKDE